MKGIVLAGGSGTRLYPMTAVSSKQLLPIFDKPMVYYPISTVIRAGVTEILIISSPQDLPLYEDLLGDGSEIGVRFQYAIQENPEGLAQALTIGEEFLDSEDCILILGDNLFHGEGMGDFLKSAADKIRTSGGAHLFGTCVNDPERFGVANVDNNGKIIQIIEKPENPTSNIAVTGLYMFDSDASKRAMGLKPSNRGELEITDLNMTYVDEGVAEITVFDENVVWLDTGTPDSLLAASIFVSTKQEEMSRMIGSIEQVAFEEGLASGEMIIQSAERLPLGNLYGGYLRRMVGK